MAGTSLLLGLRCSRGLTSNPKVLSASTHGSQDGSGWADAFHETMDVYICMTDQESNKHKRQQKQTLCR